MPSNEKMLEERTKAKRAGFKKKKERESCDCGKVERREWIADRQEVSFVMTTYSRFKN